MKIITGHPENLDVYFDRETSDPGYLGIRIHLEACSECRRKVEGWKSFNKMFRDGEPEIEVPPFQWNRIEAQLRTQKSGFHAGWLSWVMPRGLAWKTAVASLALAATILTGYEYRKSQEDKQLLLAVSRYAAEEGPRIAAGGNPFRIAGAADENPFARDRFTEANKTSAAGR